MKTQMLGAVWLVIAVAGIDSPPARAGEIQVLLKDQSELRAELISVRDSGLIVCRMLDVSNDVLRSNPRLASVVPLRSIDRIRIEGKSHVVTGALLGVVGGGLAGGLIGAAVKTESEQRTDFFSTVIVAPIENTSNTLTGVLIGALGGLLVGAMIGGSASTIERAIDPRIREELELLREYARYPGSEPEFLRNVPAE